MAGVRIRWRGVARAAAIVVVGLIALRLLPGLLRAPEPPPLAADVGLPRAKPAASESEPVRAVVKREPEQPRRRPKRQRRKSKPRPTKPKRMVRTVADEPASKAVIGTRRTRRRHPHRKARRHQQQAAAPPAPVESAPAAVPEYVPPPPSEPAQVPLPEPPPTPPAAPGDGSEEFAPH
jgi:hypothetical protein